MRKAMGFVGKQGVLSEMDIIALLENALFATAVFFVFSFNYEATGLGTIITNGAIAAFIAIELFQSTRRRAQVVPNETIPYLVFAAIAILSSFWSINPERTFSRGLSCFLMFCWFVSIVQYLDSRTKNGWAYAISIVLFSACFSAGFELISSDFLNGNRVGGATGNINQSGAYVMYASLVGLYAYKTRLVKRWVPILLIILGGIIAVTGGSRSLFAAFIIGLVVFPVVYELKNKGHFSFKILAYLVVAAIAAYLFFEFVMTNPVAYEILGRRIQSLFEILSGQHSNTNESSYFERGYFRQLAISLWVERPILGNGIDTFGLYAWRDCFCHNNFLEILEGLGVVGFISYYCFHFRLLMKLKQMPVPNLALSVSLLLLMMLFHWNVVFYYQKLEFLFMAVLLMMTRDIGNNHKWRVSMTIRDRSVK